MIEALQLWTAEAPDPYWNLAAEERLTDTLPRGTYALFLWQNQRTVVIGRNQNPWKECRTALLEAEGGHLARRLSGGGAVFHDLGNLNFSIMAWEEDYDVPRQMGVVVEACRCLGLPAECSGRNDVTIRGRKFSGNAFSRRLGRCCHHGTLLVDVDTELMQRYLTPSPAKLQAKGVDSVPSRVVNLRELKPDLTIPDMARAMAEAFQTVCGLPLQRREDWDRPAIQALAARNASWEWLYGQTLEASFACGDRFPWGEVEVRLLVQEGRVARAQVYTDALDETLAPVLEGALTGRRFAPGDLREAIQSSGLAPEAVRDLCALLERQAF